MSKDSSCSGIYQKSYVCVADITTGIRTGLDANIAVPARRSARVNIHSYSAHLNDCAASLT